LNSIRTQADDKVALGNIAFADPYQAGRDAVANIQDKVVVTLVNIEEEKTLRNTPHTTARPLGQTYQNPPIFLNLYVLFSVNSNNYENALIYLSDIISFFQREKVFTPTTHPELEGKGIEKLVFDLYTLSFEQMNHLWAVLGGKYIPSVLYKVRLIQIQHSPEVEAPVILQVDNESKVFFSAP
jgi:Pvc16 N-terminal domain